MNAERQKLINSGALKPAPAVTQVKADHRAVALRQKEAHLETATDRAMRVLRAALRRGA